MLKLDKKIIISLFITSILYCNASFAQYDTVKAKTIPTPSNELQEKTTKMLKYGVADIEEEFLEEEYHYHKDGLEEKTFKFFNKFKKNKAQTDTQIEEETPFDDENGSIEKSETVKPKPYKAIEIDEKNKFKINADKISYSEEDGNIYAIGNVEIISNKNNTTIKADTAVLDKNSQTLKLHNNVRVLRNGAELTGEYLLVDFNEENVLIENPKYNAYMFEITAQEGFLLSNNVELINGVVKIAQNEEFSLESRSFQRYENVAVDRIRHKNYKRTSDGTNPDRAYLIKTKNMVLTSYKDHNSLVLKDSDIYYNNHRVAKKTDIEFVTDKQKEVMEFSAPEMGTFKGFGTYVAYGFVNKLPKGHTLKIAPALTYGDNNLGVGLIGRYRTQRGYLDAGYSTSTTNLVARGRYDFGNGLNLKYGRNAYIPEGFLGARRSGYSAQLQKTKAYYNTDLKIRYYHGLYAGIMSDYQKHDQEDAYSTTRFRYMAEIRKNIFAIQNKEQNTSMSLNLMAQGAATLYGDGSTTGIARFGPFVTTRFKRWESSLGYMLSGVHGDSPFWFDKYRYGKSTIMLNEKINFNDKFAIGYRATITPMKDNFQEDLITESRLYAMMGPQDLKLVLSYDAVRSIAHVDFMFIVGSDNSRIEFEKFTTKNIDESKNKRDFYKSRKSVKIDPSETL